MPQCKSMLCTVNNRMCDTQHRCFTCKECIHLICCFQITVKETGDFWEDLAFPGNCVECNKDAKNRFISLEGLNKWKASSNNKNESVGTTRKANRARTVDIFSPRYTRSRKKKKDLPH